MINQTLLGIGPPILIENSNTKFRAISTPNGRKGIRLESIYWNTLQTISNEEGVSIAELVTEVDQEYSTKKNLTSALRVHCLNWTLDQVDRFKKSTSDQMIRNLLFACPTPAVALLSNRQLLSFNQTFINYVSKSFAVYDMHKITASLRLVLDRQLDQISSELQTNGNKPVSVGMAIGMNNKRIRGQVNTILMPNQFRDVLIGFVVE